MTHSIIGLLVSTSLMTKSGTLRRKFLTLIIQYHLSQSFAVPKNHLYNNFSIFL